MQKNTTNIDILVTRSLEHPIYLVYFVYKYEKGESNNESFKNISTVCIYIYFFLVFPIASGNVVNPCVERLVNVYM